ncbi:ATP-binding protein [Nocardiopsis alba]
MKCIAAKRRDNRLLSAPYQMLRYSDPDKLGLRVRHTVAARAAAQNWVRRHAARGIANPMAAAEIANRASLIAWELMDNAHRHSHSGAPDQTLTLMLERSRYLLSITVTDAGPTPGCKRLSFPEQKSHGGGLGRVASLSFYWDWDGCAGLPVTVKARIELP